MGLSFEMPLKMGARSKRLVQSKAWSPASSSASVRIVLPRHRNHPGGNDGSRSQYRRWKRGHRCDRRLLDQGRAIEPARAFPEKAQLFALRGSRKELRRADSAAEDAAGSRTHYEAVPAAEAKKSVCSRRGGPSILEFRLLTK